MSVAEVLSIPKKAKGVISCHSVSGLDILLQ